MPMWSTAKFAALAEEIAQATGQQRTPQQVAEGFLQIAVANMANAIKQVSVQKGHDATRFALQCFGGAGGQHACLVADALGHGDGVHPSVRRRAVRLWHGSCRPDGHARTGRGNSARAARHGGTARACRSAGGRGDGGARGAGRRSGAHHRAAQSASALCRHRGGADRSAARRSARSSPTSPRRIARASASPRRIGRWWSRRSRSRRSRPASAVQEATLPARTDGAPRADRHDPDVHRRRGTCRAGVRSHRSAGGRSHRRSGADPRGQRHHRGGARLDRGDHRARSHDAAPHRARSRRASPPAASGPIRCCWNCSTTCS